MPILRTTHGLTAMVAIRSLPSIASSSNTSSYCNRQRP